MLDTLPPPDTTTRRQAAPWSALLPVVRGVAASAWQTLAPALRCDRCAYALLALYGLLWVPLLPRQVANPRLLASLINDEPLLTQELVAMTFRPYGNPSNLDGMNPRHHPVPAYWGSISYYGACYYGGTYLDLACLLFLPFKALGLPDFPAAPLALRTVSVLGGMVSLLVLYNLGKRLSGRWTGFLAGLWLIGDSHFAYYSAIIHPDTTMMALSLLALWVAIRHAETGTIGSLVGLGVLMGLGHGAKMGGPWLVPMAALATAWGVQTSADAHRIRCFVGRMTLLGLVALGAFALCTPYAFLDSFYFKVLRLVWRVYKGSPFGEVTARTWWDQLWLHEGTTVGTLTVLALAVLPVRGYFSRHRALLSLSATLAGSVLAFYLLTVKLWVVIGYLLPALALLGLFAADLLVRPLGALRRFARWPTWAAALVVAYYLLPAFYERALGVVAHALTYHCVERNTTLYINRWAQEHLPHDARILHDDIAYFDPAVFPNARMHGGLLTYADLTRERPDYFILSGSIYQSAHYVELRKTQAYTRGHEGDTSVLLYQDLLDRSACPEAEHVATLAHTRPPATSAWDNVVGLARMALGLDDYLTGTEIRLYRYRSK